MHFLERIASAEHDHARSIAALAVLLTLALAFGLGNIRLQTDISKELPQDIDAIVVQNAISDIFGSRESVMILVSIDRECVSDSAPDDIRDYRVMRYLYEIEESIRRVGNVAAVQSAASFFGSKEAIPENNKIIIDIFKKSKQSNKFFNKDYTATLVFVSADTGSGERQIENFMNSIRSEINSIRAPACVKITITGNAPIRLVIMRFLKEDLVYTMSIAFILIFILIMLIKRSLSKAVLVLTPLIFGLAWTLGIMGWLNMPLSIATAGLGAMILGLGTEYGIFLFERYGEERKKGKSQKEAMIKALPSVGSGIIGSGTTTIAGFLALLFATMPMIRNLGIILALGIASILLATIFVAPAFIVIEERVLSIKAQDGVKNESG